MNTAMEKDPQPRRGGSDVPPSRPQDRLSASDEDLDFVVEWQLAEAATAHADGVRRGASRGSHRGVGSLHIASRPC